MARKPATTAKPAAPSDAHAAERAFAQQVLDSESRAIAHIAITPDFHRAVDLIVQTTGPQSHSPEPGTPNPQPASASGAVVVTGVGKSGLIGRKISATFASTGTPSHFLHPTEAMHGDLGRVRRGDLVLAVSYRGYTEEVVALATILRQDGVPVIAIVATPDCELARLATLALCIGDLNEACPLNLAPTTSTTATLALGDALALCVSRRRNFGLEDYQKVHPGGSLGRLLMPITQAMRFRAGESLALIPPGLTVQQAYARAAEIQPSIRQPGALLVTDSAGRLAGIFTDGYLRKMLLKHGPSIWQQPIDQLMPRNPRSLPQSALVRDAVQLVREFRFDEIPVVDADGRPVGLIDVQDLIALKVIEG